MGTQQLLLIALAVVLIGIAIAVGIYMFNYQAYNANRQAIMVEMASLRAKAVEYWSLPPSMGGAGNDMWNADLQGLAAYLGFSEVFPSSKIIQIDYIYVSENGEYHLNSFNEADMEIEALGMVSFRGKFPHVVNTVNVDSNEGSFEIKGSKVFNNGRGHTYGVGVAADAGGNPGGNPGGGNPGGGNPGGGNPGGGNPGGGNPGGGNPGGGNPGGGNPGGGGPG